MAALAEHFSWIWLAIKGAAYLWISLSAVEIVVVAYQQF